MARFKGGTPAPDLAPTNRGPLAKPFIFYFSLMMDAYDQTIRLSCRALLTIVLVMSNFYSALCLAVVQFSSPFTLAESIWPPGLGPSTGLEI